MRNPIHVLKSLEEKASVSNNKYERLYRKEGMGGLVLKGTEAKILSDVVAQFYAYLSGCMFNDPVGMAIYAELHYMMSSLMLGEWFE